MYESIVYVRRLVFIRFVPATLWTILRAEASLPNLNGYGRNVELRNDLWKNGSN
jgi:hypothetical protein